MRHIAAQTPDWAAMSLDHSAGAGDQDGSPPLPVPPSPPVGGHPSSPSLTVLQGEGKNGGGGPGVVEAVAQAAAPIAPTTAITKASRTSTARALTFFNMFNCFPPRTLLWLYSRYEGASPAREPHGCRTPIFPVVITVVRRWLRSVLVRRRGPMRMSRGDPRNDSASPNREGARGSVADSVSQDSHRVRGEAARDLRVCEHGYGLNGPQTSPTWAFHKITYVRHDGGKR